MGIVRKEIVDLQTREDWNAIREIILDKVRDQENASCSAILISSITMYGIVLEIEIFYNKIFLWSKGLNAFA